MPTENILLIYTLKFDWKINIYDGFSIRLNTQAGNIIRTMFTGNGGWDKLPLSIHTLL